MTRLSNPARRIFLGITLPACMLTAAEPARVRSFAALNAGTASVSYSGSFEAFEESRGSGNGAWLTVPLRLTAGAGCLVGRAFLAAEGMGGLMGGVGAGPFRNVAPAGYASGGSLLLGGLLIGAGITLIGTSWVNEGGWGNLRTDRVSLRSLHLRPAFDGGALMLRF